MISIRDFWKFQSIKTAFSTIKVSNQRLATYLVKFLADFDCFLVKKAENSEFFFETLGRIWECSKFDSLSFSRFLVK